MKGPLLKAHKIKVESHYLKMRGGSPHIGADLHAYDENGERINDAEILSGTDGVVHKLWTGHKEL